MTMLMMLVMVTMLIIERVMIVVDIGDCDYDEAIHLTNSASSSCRDPSLSSRLVIVENDQQQNWRLFSYFGPY